jgi:hypothetical protein
MHLKTNAKLWISSIVSVLLAAPLARAQTSPPADTGAPAEPAKAEAPKADTVQPAYTEPRPPGPPSETRPEEPWFKRQAFEFNAGSWKFSAYGVVEFNIFNDSTRSFQEGSGNNLVARDGTYASSVGRTIVTARNSRIGFKMIIPEFEGIKTTGIVEGDFDGNQPSNPPTLTEASYYTNATFRLRYANVKLESGVIDVQAGQALNLFGNGPYFFPCTTFQLGLPNMVFSRTPQLRIAKTLKTKAVNVDIGVAGLRPPGRDSLYPDAQAALRLSINDWKGVHTPGYVFTTADPMAIGISGVARRFKVDQFAATPTGQSTDTGWGVSIDAFIPVIPVKDSDDRSNALSLTGTFTTGSGIADLYGMNGGITFPALPAGQTGTFTPDIDPGMVTYDPGGVLHTIPWTTFMAGAQYYLPPSGRLFISGNYTQAQSTGAGNIVDLVGGETLPSGMPNTRAATVIKKAQYVDGCVFFDITRTVRTSVSIQEIWQTYGDETKGKNRRFTFAMYYQF